MTLKTRIGFGQTAELTYPHPGFRQDCKLAVILAAGLCAFRTLPNPFPEWKEPGYDTLIVPYSGSLSHHKFQMEYICLMETLDIWKDIHPSLATIPVEREYTMPYGIVYTKTPSGAAQNFIQMIQVHADSKKGESH